LRSSKTFTSAPDRTPLAFIQIEECNSAVAVDAITHGAPQVGGLLLGKRDLERNDLIWIHVAPNEIDPDTALRDVGRTRPKLLRLIKLGNDNPNKGIECETWTSPWVRIGASGWRLGHGLTPQFRLP
jgi:hypothetical protein